MREKEGAPFLVIKKMPFTHILSLSSCFIVHHYGRLICEICNPKRGWVHDGWDGGDISPLSARLLNITYTQKPEYKRRKGTL